jgi:phosphatidylglycerol:prolipoprotein diacylglycerol transferase
VGARASDGVSASRRAPTQQLESLSCLVIGLTALFFVPPSHGSPAGTVFVGALAAYTVFRQILFFYRAEPRRSSLGASSMIAAGLVLVADVIVAIVA